MDYIIRVISFLQKWIPYVFDFLTRLIVQTNQPSDHRQRYADMITHVSEYMVRSNQQLTSKPTGR